jgi:SAM-dependent methyltransferase
MAPLRRLVVGDVAARRQVRVDGSVWGGPRYSRAMSASVCPSHPEAGALPLFVATDSITGERFDLVQCDSCTLARTDPQPTGEELSRYYPTGYHASTKRYRFGLDSTLALVLRSRVRRIERLTGGPGRVLDVGCGPGGLLKLMARRGWETRGTERSESAALQARTEHGLDVRAEELEAIVAEGATFDAVVLWHVAEHLPDPAKTFGEIARLLRPGGVLMVGVPNFGSPESRIGGAGWFHLDVPRHLFHFTKATLGRMLAEAGFVTREKTYLALEYDVFSFVQTFENRSGLPFNLLYNVVRRSESRLVHRQHDGARAALAVVAAVPLSAIAIAWAPIAAALRASSTMTIYAQRPLVASASEADAASASQPRDHRSPAT